MIEVEVVLAVVWYDEGEGLEGCACGRVNPLPELCEVEGSVATATPPP